MTSDTPPRATPIERLARAQFRHAGWFIALAAVLVALSIPGVRALGLRSDWVHLLPDTAPSVRALHAGEARVGATSTLTIALSSTDLPAMRRFARALAPRIEAFPPSLRVQRLDWNIGPYRDFVRRHAHLYAPLEELRTLRDALDARREWATRRANPLFIDLDDPPQDPAVLARELGARMARARGTDAEGFFVHPDGRTLAMFVRADIAGGDAARGHALQAAVLREVNALRPGTFARDLRVQLAGDVTVGVEEHDAIRNELVVATVLTVALCLVAIYALFRRARVIPLLGAALLVPVLLTFALASVTVVALNASTAFLGSIVIGNGINPGIMWLARYFEERDAGGGVEASIARAHRGAWVGTLTASLAAAVAYGSLLLTDFRGFHDFGVIGATGMVLCWALTLLLLPAFVARWERAWPMRPRTYRARGVHVGERLFHAVRAHAAGVSAAAMVLAAAGFVSGVVAAQGDPFEYDFRNLLSARASAARAMNGRVNGIVGRAGSGNAIVLLTPSREDTRALVASLNAGRAARGGAYGPVRSIDDLLPRDQDAKRPLLAEIRRSLLALRPHADAAQRREIDEWLPPETLPTLTEADLPSTVSALFTERDGTRGRIVLVEEAPGASTSDGRYLVRWAGSLRASRLPDGRAPLVIGRAPVFADMITAIHRDGPRAVAASFGAVVVLSVVAFRRWRPRALTLASLLVGVTWTVGLLVALRLRLNFLNFVALPITFGVGADYALNVTRRYAQEEGRPDAVHHAALETGAAVLVCSLTTIFGYGSLLTSANRALRSFGTAAVIGEIACMTAALIALPAALVLVTRPQRVGASAAVVEGDGLRVNVTP